MFNASKVLELFSNEKERGLVFLYLFLRKFYSVTYSGAKGKRLPELWYNCSGTLLPELRPAKRSAKRNILAHGYPFFL